jgi:hypothetical protein
MKSVSASPRDRTKTQPHHTIISFEAAESGEGAILPTWTAVDSGNVKTSRELWEYMKSQGWNVDVRLFFHCIHDRAN